MFTRKNLPYVLMGVATLMLMWLICGCSEAVEMFVTGELGPGGQRRELGPGGEKKSTPAPQPTPQQKEAEQSLFSAPQSCPSGKPSGGYPCCPNGEPSYGQPCK